MRLIKLTRTPFLKRDALPNFSQEAAQLRIIIASLMINAVLCGYLPISKTQEANIEYSEIAIPTQGYTSGSIRWLTDYKLKDTALQLTMAGTIRSLNT